MKYVYKLIFSYIIIFIIQFNYVIKSIGNADTLMYMYISLKGDNAIGIYKINKNTGEPVFVYSQSVSGGPASIALHPSKKYLFVAQRSSNSISSFKIDSLTGKLTLLNTITALENPVYIATDKSGKYLLTAYYAANKAATYSINEDGTLTGNVIKSVDTGTNTNPHAIQTDPTNKFMYLTNMTGNRILQYNFDNNTGSFAALSPSEVDPPINTGPRHFIFYNSHLMYSVNELGNSVTAYTIDTAKGILTIFQTLSALPFNFTGTNKSADIHITPDKKFLYASNRGYESIAGFKINPIDGTLTTIGYFPTVVSPREFEIDIAGNYLYAAGESNGDLTYYRINKTTGLLDSLKTIYAGKTPSWVLIVGYLQTIVNKKEVTIKNSDFHLQCTPNPFHSATKFKYTTQKASIVTMKIFDASGQLIQIIKNGYEMDGSHEIEWKNPGSKRIQKGIYYCTLKTDEGINTIKVVMNY